MSAEEYFNWLSSWDGASLRRALASNPKTSPLVLERLVEGKSKSERTEFELALMKATGWSDIEQKNSSDYILELVAENISTSAKVLVKLSEDKDRCVRRAVASNHSAPVEALIKLSKDKEMEVRWAVASSLDMPEDVLTKLAEQLWNLRVPEVEGECYKDCCVPILKDAMELLSLKECLAMGAKLYTDGVSNGDGLALSKEPGGKMEYYIRTWDFKKYGRNTVVYWTLRKPAGGSVGGKTIY